MTLQKGESESQSASAQGQGLPDGRRAAGRIALTVGLAGTRTEVLRLAESGSARLRFTRSQGEATEAVLINTAGGIVGGDHYDIAIRVEDGAALTLATAAAEKVYRAEDRAASIDTSLSLGRGAILHWLPQEAILFDRFRLRRRFDVDLHGTSAAVLFDALVFGRAASAETVRSGELDDRWRIRRDGRLVHVEALRFAGPIHDLLARPAIADGARAMATLVHVAPDAEARLEPVRDQLRDAASPCGASAWDGRLAVRWLAPDIAMLRRDVVRFMTWFRERPLPRNWDL